MTLRYTASTRVQQDGELPARILLWDGLQLVCIGPFGAFFTIPRNTDYTYDADVNTQAADSLPTASGSEWQAADWDGRQLVLLRDDNNETSWSIWTLARNNDGSYSPANAVNAGDLPRSDYEDITWNGTELVLIRDVSTIETLTPDSGGTYTPADAVVREVQTLGSYRNDYIAWDGSQEVYARNASNYRRIETEAQGVIGVGNSYRWGGFDWDGQQLIFWWTNDPNDSNLWTWPPDNLPPIVSASGLPLTIDHAGTITLEATAIDPNGDALTYQWMSSITGTFSDDDALDTDWTAPSTLTLSALVHLTLTVTDSTGLSTSVVVSVSVREQGQPDLALPAAASQVGATGDDVDLRLPAAMGGRTPYTYSVLGLPDDLVSLQNRVRGRLVTPGTYTVMYKVTDSDQDAITREFTWTVTGSAILPPPGLNIRVNWGQQGYGEPESNVTRRIVGEIDCQRGRNINSVLLGRSIAGYLRCELDNSDGLFDVENSESPLFGLLRPGSEVQFRDGGDLVWAGVLDSIPTKYHSSGRHRATLNALGVFSKTLEPDIHEGSLTTNSTYQAFSRIVNSANIPVVGADTRNPHYVMGRWWERGKMQGAIEHIEDTEGGVVYEDRRGRLGFQSEGHRASRSLAAEFNGLAPSLGGIPIVGTPRRPVSIKDVHNIVIGYVRQFATRVDTIFQLEEPVCVSLGGSLTLVADYESGGAIRAIVPVVAGTDYIANSVSDGNGDNLSLNVTINPTVGDFNEVNVEILYPVIQGLPQPAQAYVTKLDISGDVLAPITPLKVRRQDTQSLERYDPKSLELRETWRAAADMSSLADGVLDLLAQPETRLRFDWYVENLATFRDLELSDRIRVKLPGYIDDAFVEQLRLRIPLAGGQNICTVHATVTDLPLPDEQVPVQPMPPLLRDLARRRMTSQWSQPDDGGSRILDYDLRWREVGTQAWTTETGLN